MFVNFCCSCSSRILLKSSSIRSFKTSVQRLNRKTYYEILGVKNDCSQKEIRHAFVSLSKELHPDVNASKVNDKSSNQDFIQLMEAYQVLSKTHSRANYDLSLRGIGTVHYINRDTIYEPYKNDPSAYTERGPYDSPYYGVKGIRKMPHWKIVCACIMFCAFGVMIQLLAITKSFTFKRKQLDYSSAVYQENHERVRINAEKLGNAEQIERLKLRLKKSPYDVEKSEV